MIGDRDDAGANLLRQPNLEYLVVVVAIGLGEGLSHREVGVDIRF